MRFNIHSAKKTKIFCCSTHVALSIDVDVWIKLNKLLIDADVKNQKKKKSSDVQYNTIGLGPLCLDVCWGHGGSQLTTRSYFAVCTVGIPTPQAPRSWLSWLG